LIQYHFSTNHAIFFFTYKIVRNGVTFYLIIKKEELFGLIKDSEFLIKEDTNVFVMKTIYSTESISFQQIDSHCDYDKYMNCLSNEFVFELTRDIADPTLDYLPFIFYQKEDSCKFEIFFCFLNVEAAGEYLFKNNN